MGKKHASQYANFGSLQNIDRVYIEHEIEYLIFST